MTVLQAFGHTPGATSFSYPVMDAGKTYNVLIVNMDGINAGVKLLGSPGYPTIVEDFKNTLAIQATYTPDIWVSSHAGQLNLPDLQARRRLQSGAVWRSRGLPGEDRGLSGGL